MTQQNSFALADVRLTFPNIFEAKQVNGQGDPKFSAAFIIRKDHPQLPAIKQAIADAALAKWGDAPTDAPGPLDAAGNPTTIKLPKYQAMLKSLAAADKLCLHDGDAKSEIPGYAGNFFINASNKLRPLVVDGQKQVLDAASGKPYSGCYVNARIQFWGQDNQFGKRVNASLMGIQFLRDGERLSGGGVAAADDFEAVPGTAAAGTAVPAAAGAAAMF